MDRERARMESSLFGKVDDKQSGRSLVFGVTTWFVHFNILNILTSLSCKWGWFPFSVGGLPGVKVIEIIINLIALLIMLVLVYLPYRNWRSFQTEAPAQNPNLLEDTAKDRRPLMAFIAMSLNTVLTMFVLASFVLLFVLQACGPH